MARGRPREHDLDTLLDHARALWVEQGRAGVTIRALSARSGVGNGAIYHALGSRAGLLARTWVREAEGFLAFQRARVEDVLAGDGSTRAAVEAVVAAALAPATYAEAHPEAARLLLATHAADLLVDELGDDDRAAIGSLQTRLGALLAELAAQLWGSADRTTVALARICVVDLPGTLLLGEGRPDDPVARHALEAAVRGVLASPPPEREVRRTVGRT